MVIRIEVMPWLSELVSGSISKKETLIEEVPDHATLRTVLGLLEQRYDRLGKMVYDSRGGRLTGHAEIAVNGSLYDQAGGLDAPLSPGDTISFLPGIAGGSHTASK